MGNEKQMQSYNFKRQGHKSTMLFSNRKILLLFVGSMNNFLLEVLCYRNIPSPGTKNHDKMTNFKSIHI